MARMARIGRLIGSLALAGFALWIAGAFFCNSGSHVVFDRELGQFVPAPGTSRKWRSEGWATTCFGPHGLLRDTASQISTNTPLIFLHGDSFVEALQVNDVDKPETQLTRALRATAPASLGRNAVVLGLGYSGLAAADVYFRIPRYEHVFGGPRLHIIMFSGMFRFLPDANQPVTAVFTRTPQFRFAERATTHDSAWNLPLTRLLDRLHGYVIWHVRRKLAAADALDLRFAVGPVRPSAHPAPPPDDPAAARAAFNFLAARLRAQTRAPILVVYSPSLPGLRDGRLIETDASQAMADELAVALHAQGIAFLNTRPSLLDVYRQEHRLPFGFANLKLGSGHLNDAGIRAVAECVAAYLADPSRHALFAN